MQKPASLNVYKRLDGRSIPNPDTLDPEDEITEDLFKDKYDSNQFKKIPWKGIILAIFLFLLGSIVLTVGILIVFHYLPGDKAQGSI